MRKEMFVQVLADRAGVKRQEAAAVLEALTGLVSAASANVGRLRVPGLGSFAVTQRAARRGVNPRTLAPIEIPARRKVTFRPAVELTRAAGAE
jgi:DNA-binding protein HU-beta